MYKSIVTLISILFLWELTTVCCLLIIPEMLRNVMINIISRAQKRLESNGGLFE